MEAPVILTHKLWQSRFGAAPDILGRRISLDDIPFVVVGILPSGVVLREPVVVDGAEPSHHSGSPAKPRVAAAAATAWWGAFVAGELRAGAS